MARAMMMLVLAALFVSSASAFSESSGWKDPTHRFVPYANPDVAFVEILPRRRGTRRPVVVDVGPLIKAAGSATKGFEGVANHCKRNPVPTNVDAVLGAAAVWALTHKMKLTPKVREIRGVLETYITSWEFEHVVRVRVDHAGAKCAGAYVLRPDGKCVIVARRRLGADAAASDRVAAP